MAATPKKTYLSLAIEEVLGHNEQLSRPDIENCSDIVAFINAEQKLTYVSPSIASIMGYSPEEIVGCHALVLVHPDDLNSLQRLLGELQQTPGKSLSAKSRLYCKDGSWQWFEGTGTNLLHVPTIASIVATFHDIAKQELVPYLNWSEVGESEHFVQFYESDEFLLNSLSELIRIDLSTGNACIVIATKAHREGLEKILKANGLDLATAHTQGKYISLDAAETLSKFMVDGLPEPNRFTEVFESIIVQAGKDQRQVRIFGEMVALLWMEGNQAAALRLEELWDDLRHTSHDFSLFLFCVHPMPSFVGEVYGVQFIKICQQHSHVIPDESYTALVSLDERLRAITLLQQKVYSLQEELNRQRTTDMQLYLAESALQASEESFRTLASQSPIMIWQSDTAGAAVHANDSWCRFTGLSKEETLGNGWASAVHPEDRDTVFRLWMQAVTSHAPYHAQFRLRRSDGIYRDVLVYGYTSSDPEGTFTGYIGTILDITEQRELETQRETFVSMITHELKTPLTVLQGNVQLAQRRLTRLLSKKEQLLPEQQHTLEKVLDMLNRCQQPLQMEHRMINDLLDSSRIQENKLELCLAACDLAELVSNTVQDHQAAHPSRLITLELPEQDSPQVYADCDRIQQVISNYLTNALKFSPHTEPVHVGLSREAENVRVWVQDHGPGLSYEQQQHIWQRFYQVSQPSTQRGSQVGLGLGLYICQQLISRQQGQVGVESTPGSGSTFWFTLPLLSSCQQ